ncbi:uncharacterized protein MCYG_04035 [Microsporum canis CBS 113480]|uniref:Uncharacterized protein n=1 Tax=Arthroderma otae (strain ATCC MYA-4605 / CBS 113480) TaxID=554155 RepID=C5FMY0_ARTOC|nr:uncharacterized protein MCYG_04035 [Microsporum canis CBS 113480]EEQ31216.1 predicted protein [Microsporum canis CBS 113480]
MTDSLQLKLLESESVFLAVCKEVAHQRSLYYMTVDRPPAVARQPAGVLQVTPGSACQWGAVFNEARLWCYRRFTGPATITKLSIAADSTTLWFSVAAPAQSLVRRLVTRSLAIVMIPNTCPAITGEHFLRAGPVRAIHRGDMSARTAKAMDLIYTYADIASMHLYPREQVFDSLRIAHRQLARLPSNPRNHLPLTTLQALTT